MSAEQHRAGLVSQMPAVAAHRIAHVDDALAAQRDDYAAQTRKATEGWNAAGALCRWCAAFFGLAGALAFGIGV